MRLPKTPRSPSTSIGPVAEVARLQTFVAARRESCDFRDPSIQGGRIARSGIQRRRFLYSFCLFFPLWASITGCQSNSNDTTTPADPAAHASDTESRSVAHAEGVPANPTVGQDKLVRGETDGPDGGDAPLPVTETGSNESLADLLLDAKAQELLRAPAVSEGPAAPQNIPPNKLPADPAIVGQHGIRVLLGQYIRVYTDLPDSTAVNDLPQVFDAAVTEWMRYFSVPRIRLSNWHVTAYVMNTPDRFRATGLLPDDLPNFLHGFQRGEEFWVYDQPSEYYLRHIFIHEGTHAFMNNVLGGAGPPWYMEGIAELMATHRWENGKLTLRYMPVDKAEVPYWGRIKIIKDEFAANRGMMIHEVLRIDASQFLKLEPYAWCWGVAAFLDGHPAFQMRFRSLRNEVRDPSVRFTHGFEEQVINQLRQLDEEWQLFVMNAEYGYDFERAAVHYKAGSRLPNDGADVRIAADRGWQSAGYRLESGETYRITASGKYQLAKNPKPWWSEPNGVTIRYYQDRPLGMLVGNIRMDQARRGIANLGRPVTIGRSRTVLPTQAGTLYLKVNESSAELADNAGYVQVRIERLDDSAQNDRL